MVDSGASRARRWEERQEAGGREGPASPGQHAGHRCDERAGVGDLADGGHGVLGVSFPNRDQQTRVSLG